MTTTPDSGQLSGEYRISTYSQHDVHPGTSRRPPSSCPYMHRQSQQSAKEGILHLPSHPSTTSRQAPPLLLHQCLTQALPRQA